MEALTFAVKALLELAQTERQSKFVCMLVVIVAGMWLTIRLSMCLREAIAHF
jgi:diacylglycerol kinase